MNITKKIIMRELETIEPGCSGSRRAGFDGYSTYKRGVDSEGQSAVLIAIEGWHKYSRKSRPCYITRKALILKDETGLVTKRVSPKCETVKQACDWLEPKPVKTARLKGKSVIRQGDVYFVESKKDKMDLLPWNHRIHEYNVLGEIGRIAEHHEHKTIDLGTGNYRVYIQKSLPSTFGGSKFTD